jgi:NAD(P)-dependent dehydrogenase (short-subunit alcohol dehydrogenase family)
MPTYSKWICENQQLAFEASQIETTEMIEVQLVNSPFVLCNRLSEVKKRQYRTNINVSAMEGKFHRFFKEARHPHTNMAKAALNMLTHTAAGDLAKPEFSWR